MPVFAEFPARSAQAFSENMRLESRQISEQESVIRILLPCLGANCARQRTLWHRCAPHNILLLCLGALEGNSKYATGLLGPWQVLKFGSILPTLLIFPGRYSLGFLEPPGASAFISRGGHL